MSTEKTEAVVIRQANFSESSRVVTLYTRDFGKISALAKGAKRLKGAFDAGIDLLAVCRIVFIRKSSATLDLLTEAQLISHFRPNGRDLVSLYGGYYVAELLSSLTEEYDPHPVLYDEAIQALRRLSKEPAPKLSLLRFELAVLREIGQLPTFDACVVCGSTVAKDQSFAYWVSQSGLICRNCQKQGFQQDQIHPGTVSLLQDLVNDSATPSEQFVASAQQHRELRKFVTSSISFVLGRRPKMLRYFND